jgi:hypothetical protein
MRFYGWIGLFLVACAPPPAGEPVEGDDPYKGSMSGLSRTGRWALPADVKAAGEAQYVGYEGAPAWSGGSNCSGSFLPGARELGEHLVSTFGASSYDGYSCRPNTASPSQQSMHGSGRAIDVFVPQSGGGADNDAGDPIANWLVEHAEEIGVQFIIWDQTKWNGSYSGAKDAPYGGPHPHDDHLHVELTADGANRLTAWFSGGGSSEPSPTESDPGTGETDPWTEEPSDPGTSSGGELCSDACRWAYDGECDDGGEGSSYSVCGFGTDCGDCGPRGGDEPTEPTEPMEPIPSEPGGSGRCDDSCEWAADGVCDDGGEGSWYSVCDLGTDCSDCGAR